MRRVAPCLALLLVLPGVIADGPGRRVEEKAYVGGGLFAHSSEEALPDCGSDAHLMGACFPLSADETRAHVSVRDDLSPDVCVAAAIWNETSTKTTLFCDQGTVLLDLPGATILRVKVTAGVSVPTQGTITVTFTREPAP